MKKCLVINFYFLIFIGFTHHLIAQSDQTGNWMIYFGNQKLDKKWNWHNEVQYRNYDLFSDLQQILLRSGIGYNLSENNNNLLLGYAYIHSQNYEQKTNSKTGVNEHRIFQQFITRQNFGRTFIQHRYRMEERFFEDDFLLRFRYFLSVNIPLNNRTMTAKTFYLSVYDEIFLNSKNNIFDRNRLYGALGYVLNFNFRFELGFMNQALENLDRNQFQIVLFNSIPFLKVD